MGKLRGTKDADMRYLGSLLLANLACDIEHNETLMKEDVVPVLLQCIMRSPKDQRVQSNSITVLFNLSVRRPDCVKQMKKAGAQRILQKAYDCHGVNENCQIHTHNVISILKTFPVLACAGTIHEFNPTAHL